MEVYCLYAQNYFLEETALEDVTAEIGEIAPASKSGSIEGITHWQTSLVLEGMTTIRHYFRVTDATVLDGITATVDGEEIALDKTLKSDADGSYFRVDITDIPAQKLGTQYTLKLISEENELAVTYSATNYVAQAYETEGKLGNLTKTLYNYFIEANEYKDYLEHKNDLEIEDDEICPDKW